MANRAPKRVHAIRRAPSGSAFLKCYDCGVSVAIALLDMHEWECRGRGKKLKSLQKISVGFEWDERFRRQPRSPFQIFIGEYREACTVEDPLMVDRTGFERWKNMSNEERKPYKDQASKLDSAYHEELMEEINYSSEVDDEADSAMVGKFDLNFIDLDSPSSSYSGSSDGRASVDFHSLQSNSTFTSSKHR